MILMYEDEAFYIEEYIEAIKNEGFEIHILDNADEFLAFAKKKYENIRLFIIDIMVFGPGNEFGNRNTEAGATGGLILLDEIEKLEIDNPKIKSIKKIIFTNRKGTAFDKAKADKRVLKAFKKSDVFPAEFAKFIKEAIQDGMG